MFVFRLRSLHELEAVVEENSALYGADKTREIYNVATKDPYSFLWINARAKSPEDTFWLRLEARLVPAEVAGPSGAASESYPSPLAKRSRGGDSPEPGAPSGG